MTASDARTRLFGALDRYPLNSPWVRGIVARWWLPVWFALMSLTVPPLTDAHPTLFFDSKLYVAAAEVWLEGGDPWTVQLQGIYFAAPPPSLIPLIPFALMPEPIGANLLGILTIGAAVASIRMLKLPTWWLLFPPIVDGVLSGNVQLFLVPLLLSRGSWLAILLKAYAAVPVVILGRWRSLAIALGIILVSAPLLPWALYIGHFREINALLALQSSYGLSTEMAVLALPVGLICLWIVGRQSAAWLAVPALWPSQQWYYATLILPTKSRLVAAIISTHLPVAGLISLVALAAVRWVERRNGPSRSSPIAD